MYLTVAYSRTSSKLSDLGPKWVKLAPNPGIFQSQAKVYWNLIWKIPGFVRFWASLPHSGPKFNVPKATSTPRVELFGADDVKLEEEGDPEEELSLDGN